MAGSFFLYIIRTFSLPPALKPMVSGADTPNKTIITLRNNVAFAGEGVRMKSRATWEGAERNDNP